MLELQKTEILIIEENVSLLIENDRIQQVGSRSSRNLLISGRKRSAYFVKELYSFGTLGQEQFGFVPYNFPLSRKLDILDEGL